MKRFLVLIFLLIGTVLVFSQETEEISYYSVLESIKNSQSSSIFNDQNQLNDFILSISESFTNEEFEETNLIKNVKEISNFSGFNGIYYSLLKIDNPLCFLVKRPDGTYETNDLIAVSSYLNYLMQKKINESLNDNNHSSETEISSHSNNLNLFYSYVKNFFFDTFSKLIDEYQNLEGSNSQYIKEKFAKSIEDYYNICIFFNIYDYYVQSSEIIKKYKEAPNESISLNELFQITNYLETQDKILGYLSELTYFLLDFSFENEFINELENLNLSINSFKDKNISETKNILDNYDSDIGFESFIKNDYKETFVNLLPLFSNILNYYGLENIKSFSEDSREMIKNNGIDSLDKFINIISDSIKDQYNKGNIFNINDIYNFDSTPVLLGIKYLNLKENGDLDKLLDSEKYENMALVEGGSFFIGCSTGQEDEKVVYEVTLTNDFYIGKYEVTFAEFDEFCEENNLEKPYDNDLGRGNLPVMNISWFDAINYCNWLSLKENLPVAYSEEGKLLDANGNETTDITEVLGYRLPTEAEWEFAAQGGNLSKGFVYSGSDDINEIAWIKDNANGTTHEVGTKKPNELGIYDMSGNVSEWVFDLYKEQYCVSANINPIGPASSEYGPGRRGGGWKGNASGGRVTNRYYHPPNEIKDSLGFRICINK